MLSRVVEHLAHRAILHELSDHVYLALVLRNAQEEDYIGMSELHKHSELVQEGFKQVLCFFFFFCLFKRRRILPFKTEFLDRCLRSIFLDYE